MDAADLLAVLQAVGEKPMDRVAFLLLILSIETENVPSTVLALATYLTLAICIHCLQGEPKSEPRSSLPPPSRRSVSQISLQLRQSPPREQMRSSRFVV